MAANFFATSTAENLNASHPIRRMLRPHTYGTMSINLRAVDTLAPEGGVLHRNIALTWKGMKHGFRESLKLIRSALYDSAIARLQARLALSSSSAFGGRGGLKAGDIGINLPITLPLLLISSATCST